MDAVEYTFSCRLITDPSGSYLIPYSENGGILFPWETASFPPEWDGWKIIVYFKSRPPVHRDCEKAKPK